MRSGLTRRRTVALQDRVVMRGRGRIIERCAKTGRIRRVQVSDNLIVDSGLAFLIDRLKGDTFNTASYFAVGTDATPAAATQTGLINEVFRTQVTASRRVGNTQLRITGFLTSGMANGYVLREFALFGHPDPNTGPMLCRLVYGAVTKNVSTQVTFIWTGTLAAS